MQIQITVSSVEELLQLAKKLSQGEVIRGLPTKPEIVINEPRKVKRSKRRWTQIEIDQVISWYNNSTFTAKEMAVALERREAGISMLIYNLKKKGVLHNKTNRSSKAKTL